MESDKTSNDKKVSTDEQKKILEIQDLAKASKRSRRVHIGFGIAALFLLGMLAVSWFTFGGLAAFWGVNLTLSLSAVGCFLGAVISKVINRKNKAKIRALEESRKQMQHTSKRGKGLSQQAILRNERKHQKHWLKDKRHLTESQINFIESRTKQSGEKTPEKTPEVKTEEKPKETPKEKPKETPKVEKFNWKDKTSLTINELVNSMQEYKSVDKDFIQNNYKTRPINAKISKVTLLNDEGKTAVIANNVLKTTNDVSYNMALLDVMNMINKTNFPTVITYDEKGENEQPFRASRIKIESEIDGEIRKDIREVKGRETFTIDEISNIRDKLDSVKIEKELGI